MKFHDPLFLALALLVLPALFFLRTRNENPGIRFSSGLLLAGMKETLRAKAHRYLPLLRALTVSLMVIALARPQALSEESKVIREGIDMVLAVDVSTSMLAEDFQEQGEKRNRLAAAKNVMRDFARVRENDRLGVVVFASRAYPVCPLTLDHDWLLENLQRVEIGMVEDGTAIGSGLMSALNGLKRSAAKSRVVILLTDGRNNAGAITAEGAAAAAKALGVKVYAIGIGSRGQARYPVRDPFGRIIYKNADADIDEETMRLIADASGGRYFRAADMETLREVYREIDGLEKTKSETRVYYHSAELFPFFLLPALCLLCFEIVLKNTALRTAPS